MKNLKLTLLLVAIAIAFASCSKIYGPALFHQDIAYIPKPASFDTVKSAGYISAGINVHSNSDYRDNLVSGQINLSHGVIFNHFNIGYGGFFEYGNYNNNGQLADQDPGYFSNKSFGAVGGRFSANLFTNMGRADFRYIGFEAAYSHEFGSYANFRSTYIKTENYYIDNRTNLFTIGLTTEVIFHNVDDVNFQHGIRGFLGTTLGRNVINDTYYRDDTSQERFFRNFFPKASYFIKFNNYFGTLEVGSGFMGRFGYKF